MTSFTLSDQELSQSPFTDEELRKECASAHRFSDAEREGGGEETGTTGNGGSGGGGDLDEKLAGWSELQAKVRLALSTHRMQLLRVETGATRAAYGHTNGSGNEAGAARKMDSWRLDHILYTNNHSDACGAACAPCACLTPVKVWKTLESDPFSTERGERCICFHPLYA